LGLNHGLRVDSAEVLSWSDDRIRLWAAATAHEYFGDSWITRPPAPALSRCHASDRPRLGGGAIAFS
jgi:hypothetical protein